jgi:hypothetical protein
MARISPVVTDVKGSNQSREETDRLAEKNRTMIEGGRNDRTLYRVLKARPVRSSGAETAMSRSTPRLIVDEGLRSLLVRDTSLEVWAGTLVEHVVDRANLEPCLFGELSRPNQSG